MREMRRQDRKIEYKEAYQILKDGEYGQDDIYIGVPAIICSDGIREVVNLDLTDEEQAKLDESCKIIKEMRANSIEKIITE